MSRIAPAEPPYLPTIAESLQRIMPPGMEPLVLFRARWRRAHACSARYRRRRPARQSDRSQPAATRDRVIDRTTARLGCEYEWGVHVALFAGKVGFGDSEIAAIVHGVPDDDRWTAEEQALLALVDDLIDLHILSDTTWNALTKHFDETQILEAIALTGYYHTISFLCRGLSLPLEAWSARFPGPAPAARR